ncbi:MAG: retroviral-like aspartic protease family protein, partial [Acidobacteriota bacterium]|nr:retroviral-like aspartic protease family protein [Acidobacteriota bacterium]
SKGSCQIVRPVESTKLSIVPIANGPRDMYAAGLELQLNGRKKRFEIDTGASGLLIGRAAAASAGIVAEGETLGGGIGDKGLVKELLAHVDSIRIGDLEFHNCLVRVLDKRSVLDVDGLIGADVFSSWLVTLDIPSREVRLAPLPKRPEDAAAESSELDTAGGGENTQAVPRDRYVAPEMKDWTPVFRYGHDLIFPTYIGNAPQKLFIMDTGAAHTLVSAAAAREVTGVGGSNARIRGLSGEVQNVSEADNLTIAFAHVSQRLPGTLAIDTANLGRGAGVEISGLIGFPTLRELIITIDYRDNLVHIIYDPKHGFHAR